MAANMTSALKSLLPKQPPPSLYSRPGSLYEVLARYPKDGVGQHVHQTRWGYKNIVGSYWVVTRSKLKQEGLHGKAWGQLYWKGECSLACSGCTYTSCDLESLVIYSPLLILASFQARKLERKSKLEEG